MAIVKRSKHVEGEKRGPKLKEDRIQVTLPTKVTPRAKSFDQFSVLIHGVRKIGKTSLFSQEEDALFLECDPIQRGVEIMQRHVPDWTTFKAYIKKLHEAAAEDKFPYKTGIVDRADILYKLCYDWVKANKLSGNDPTDLGGYESAGAWSKIKTEFNLWILRFMALPWAPRFLCHSKEAEIDQGDGTKRMMIAPDFGGQADSVISGQVDIIACYKYDGDRRVLVVQGGEDIVAGHRCKFQFKTPDGEPVISIPMGDSEEEAYANLLKAFNNEQEFVSADDDGDDEEEEVPRKKKLKKSKFSRK